MPWSEIAEPMFCDGKVEEFIMHRTLMPAVSDVRELEPLLAEEEHLRHVDSYVFGGQLWSVQHNENFSKLQTLEGETTVYLLNDGFTNDKVRMVVRPGLTPKGYLLEQAIDVVKCGGQLVARNETICCVPKTQDKARLNAETVIVEAFL